MTPDLTLSRSRGTQWTTVARRAFCFYGPNGSTHEDFITKTYRTKRPCQSHRFCSMNAAPNYHSNHNNKPSRSSTSSSARGYTVPSLWQAAIMWRKFIKLQNFLYKGPIPSVLDQRKKCQPNKEVLVLWMQLCASHLLNTPLRSTSKISRRK